MELAEKLTKNKYKHEIGVNANSAGGGRPGILKKHCQPESNKRYFFYQLFYCNNLSKIQIVLIKKKILINI